MLGEQVVVTKISIGCEASVQAPVCPYQCQNQILTADESMPLNPKQV